MQSPGNHHIGGPAEVIEDLDSSVTSDHNSYRTAGRVRAGGTPPSPSFLCLPLPHCLCTLQLPFCAPLCPPCSFYPAFTKNTTIGKDRKSGLLYAPKVLFPTLPGDQPRCWDTGESPDPALGKVPVACEVRGETQFTAEAIRM